MLLEYKNTIKSLKILVNIYFICSENLSESIRNSSGILVNTLLACRSMEIY